MSAAIHRLDATTRVRLLDALTRRHKGVLNVKVLYSPLRNGEFEREVAGALEGVARTTSGQSAEVLVVRRNQGEYPHMTLTDELVAIPVATVISVATGAASYPSAKDLLYIVGLA